MPDFNKKREYLIFIMKRLGFPEDAAKDILDAYDKIAKDEVSARWFSCLIAQYDRSAVCGFDAMLDHIKVLGEGLGIHEYTSSMMFVLCLSEKLLERYKEQGISEEIFYNSMADIYYKLIECRLIYGINGSFVSPWFIGFFEMTRFALGRLQFEILKTDEDFQIGGITVEKGSDVINMHIPRTGTRLDREEVLEAYKMAAETFADSFGDKPIIFTCFSWLLYPWNLEVLRKDSNLAMFIKDFKIVTTGEYDDYEEVWRLFDCKYNGNVNELPRDSSFRRAYAERIEKNEKLGWGKGYFIYSDGKIINK